MIRKRLYLISDDSNVDVQALIEGAEECYYTKKEAKFYCNWLNKQYKKFNIKHLVYRVDIKAVR